MTSDGFVKTRVSTFYWKDNLNCATTTLRILAEAFKIKLHKGLKWGQVSTIDNLNIS